MDSLDCKDGLIRRIQNYGRNLGSSKEGLMQLVAVSAAVSFQERSLSESPLEGRGWAFQELMVSPASLRYTLNGVEWECNEGGLLDGNGEFIDLGWFPIGVRMRTKQKWQYFSNICRGVHSRYPGNASDAGSSGGCIEEVTLTSEESLALAYTWNDFVSNFSLRNALPSSGINFQLWQGSPFVMQEN